MLASISNFFRSLVRSCYDVEFYREVRTEPTKPVARAMRYLAALVALFVIFGAVGLAPAAVAARDGIAAALKSRLPDGAVVAMKGGHLETNLPMPFDLGFKDPKAVVDTSVTGTDAEKVPEGTLVLGKDAAFFRDQDGNVQSAPYQGAPDFSFTKDQAISRVTGVSTGTIVGWVALLTVPWYLLFLLWSGLSAASSALLVQWIAKLAKAPLPYARWFAVCCYATTLPLVATALFGDWLAAIPFARSILFSMVVAAVIADERAKPTAHPEPHKAEPAHVPTPPPQPPAHG